MSGSMYKKPGPNLPALSGRFWIFFHNVVEIAENSVKPTEIRPIKSGRFATSNFLNGVKFFNPVPIVSDELVCNSIDCGEFFNLMYRVIFFKKIMILWKETV
jgi:hypothetical protein